MLVFQEKVVLHPQVQELAPELVCAPKQQEGLSDQTLALHSQLVSVETQITHQEQEKVVMKEELEATVQVSCGAGKRPSAWSSGCGWGLYKQSHPLSFSPAASC